MSVNSLKNILLFSILILMTGQVSAKNLANATFPDNRSSYVATPPTVVDKRSDQEEAILSNPFGIVFHRPTYILPYYYTGSPYNKVYVNSTPNNEKLNRAEFKYQISLKAPIWKDMFGHASTLYLAYTQLSYWQLYNKTAFFRETDYEPELYVSNQVDLNFSENFKLNFFNVGVNHQSNGFGDELERSWNRAYVEFISSLGDLMLTIKPWYVFQDSTMRKYNPNIANYLGHGQVTLAYKYAKQGVLALQAYNFIEHGGRRPSAQLTLSFPLTAKINGYVQGFTGYGQSLIEYNHRTNSIGVGITLNDWV